jgi:hypothetical protein
MAMAASVAVLGLAALAAADTSDQPRKDPEAEKYLRAMSSYLGGLRSFTYQVEMFFDVVQEDGLRLQLSNQRKLSVLRPDKIAAETSGDTSNSNFYYDGKTVTVYDRTQKTYATVNVPGNIDAMLDDLHARFGIEQPLADFQFSDPYKVLTENVQSSMYLGLHYVGKVKCHHLAFRQRLLDWQIWIDAGDKPLPRKFVITFKRQIDEPQFIALIHRWDVDPTLNPGMFEFQPPPGTRKVDFLHRHGEAPAAKKPRP